MPTSSTSSRHSRGAAAAGKRSNWPLNANENTTKISIKRTSNLEESPTKTLSRNHKKEPKLIRKQQPQQQKQQQKTSNSAVSRLATLAAKYNKIAHISPPTSLTSTSVALRNSVMVGAGTSSTPGNKGNVSTLHRRLSGESNLALDQDDETDQKSSPVSQQPKSLLGLSISQQVSEFPQGNQQQQPQVGHFAFLGGKSFLVSGSTAHQQRQFSQPGGGGSSSTGSLNAHTQHGKLRQSQASLMSQSTSSSTAQLQLMGTGNDLQERPSTLQIGRRMDLKYVKSLIIILMAVDLLITVFVHQFSTGDELNLSLAWLRSVKLRLSLINLALSSIWFVILIGGILFDVYYILFMSVLVDVASFLLLLGLSVIHFTRRLDYNAVQLTSLLALLFSIVVLHVYLLVMASLTLYLMLAVRRRQRSQRPAQQP